MKRKFLSFWTIFYPNSGFIAHGFLASVFMADEGNFSSLSIYNTGKTKLEAIFLKNEEKKTEFVIFGFAVTLGPFINCW